MLTVSLVGKKFSCNIQIKISAEKDGGGLELALKAGEKCSNRPQAISNVTASLNITIQRGCSNYVTKCKEMLMFLQEQALPKTMNIMKMHMASRETKALAQKDDSNKLFSCIRPSKRDRDRIRDRSASRDRSSTRGYSSDSEQLYRHSTAASTDSLNSRQSNKTDIIATPRMSRHRLKNAALLRNRKQREASKERSETPEKENKEQETKTKNTSMEIHLPIKENKKTNEKRYSLRSFDTEVESQGEFTYDGGSESSLRTQVIEDNDNKTANKTNDIKNTSNSIESLERVPENDRKISVTDSDMSVDSLECLDMSTQEIQEKKKKKKRKIRKRAEEKLPSKEDVTSSRSSISQMPTLALPDDFQDSSVENSDTYTTEERDRNLKTNSTSRRNSTDDLTRILSELAHQVVEDVVRSALKRCGKPTPRESKNLDNDLKEGEKTSLASVQSESSTKATGASVQSESSIKTTLAPVQSESSIKATGAPVESESSIKTTLAPVQSESSTKATGASVQSESSIKTTGASVQSDNSINDDIIEGTPVLEPEEIKLEMIEDNSAVESKTGKISTVDKGNIGVDKCGDANLANIVSEGSNDDKVESKVEDKRLDDGEISLVSVDKTLQEIPPKDIKAKEKPCAIEVASQECAIDGAVGAVEEGDTQKDPILLQNSPYQIKANKEANLEVEKTIDPGNNCSAEIRQDVTDDAKSDELLRTKNPNFVSEKAKSDENSGSRSVAKTMENNAEYDSENDKSIPSSERAERQDSHQTAVSNPPHIRLYDTHVNITNRIINSVSQVLHLQTRYTTPTQSTYLTFDPDIPLAYYTTPERGFEGILNQELPSNNQYGLEGPRPERTRGTGIEKETPQRDQKSKETFQRFMQSHRFSASDGRGPNTSRMNANQESSSSGTSGVNTSYINTSSASDPQKGYCFFVVGSDSTNDTLQEVEEESKSRVSTDEERGDLDTTPMLEPRRRRHLERPKSGVYHRSISDQNERKRWITAIQEPDLLRTVHQRSSSADARTRASRNNKCFSCPVLSEEDIVLEGLESHHKDVCNSLSQRTWVILRVHELWKAKKPLEALQMCMELTGIKPADSSTAEGMNTSNPDIPGNKDNALFLNILLQLPSGCSAWSLSMCDLLLPELKLFISTRRHTSHVDMACNVLQVIVKKVSAVILKVQKENKENPVLLKTCVAHLRDVSDRISQVLVARRGKIHTALTTEDPIALKPILRDLLSTIQTLLRVCVD